MAGTKTSTWRLFDDKNLQEGDEVQLVNQETLASIGSAVLDSVTVRTLGTLTSADWDGHERYVSDEDMYATYRGYYGDRVGPDSEVKIVRFTFQAE